MATPLDETAGTTPRLPAMHDLIIAGGGPVGSVLAQALAPLAARGRLSVLQVRAAASAADRPIALSHGSRLLLERLGLWRSLPATPIHRIHVSQRGGFGRTIISAADHGIDALGHVVGYRDLVAATALPSVAGIDAREGRVGNWTVLPDGIEVDIEGQMVRTRLLVVADGGRPDAGDGRAIAHVKVKDYRQHAVVCEVDIDRPHGNVAWERFTPDGPVALLPFRGRQALVWTVTPDEAARLCALDDAAFIAALQRAFGLRAGRFLAAGPRSAFPLSLRVHRRRARAGVIAIGNAAQTLHPVAGQGLNLGLRDAWELAEACLDALDTGSGAGSGPATQAMGAGLGSADFARAFDARRRLDRDVMVQLTDGLIGAFSLNLPCSATVRGTALAFLDAVPPARRFLSRRMMFGARAIP
jgi:2-octaprenyl-6-methoxyphenol hydroxylase